MKALLRSKGLWRLVSGTEARPTAAGDDQDKWDAKADKAAGEIMLALEADQRVHIRTVQDDPVAAWNALATLYVQQCPGARFVAYDEFFSIRKREDESLTSLTARIELAMLKIQELRSQQFTLTSLDDELVCMAMVRALPPEYSHFTSSLLLLSSLDKATIKSAFMAKDINRKPRAEVSGASGDSALAAGGARTCGCSPNDPCTFCEKPGHCEHMCFARQRAKDAHKASKRKGKGRNANKAQESPSSTTALPPAPNIPEPASATAKAAIAHDSALEDPPQGAGNTLGPLLI